MDAFSFLLPRQGTPGAHVHLPHFFCPVRLSQKQSYHPSVEEMPPFVKGPEGPWLSSLVFQGAPSSDQVVHRSITNAAFLGWSWVRAGSRAARAVRKPFSSQETGSERSTNLLKVPQRCWRTWQHCPSVWTEHSPSASTVLGPGGEPAPCPRAGTELQGQRYGVASGRRGKGALCRK